MSSYLRDVTLAVAAGVTPEEATEALFGEGTLSEARRAAVDLLANRNGRYDLGVRSRIARWRRVEARCGTTPSGSGPASSAALFGAAALGGRGHSKRPRRRGPGRRERSPVSSLGRRVRRVGSVLAPLLIAAATWTCTADLVGPPADGDIAVLLEPEGPGMETVQAPALELYQSSAPGPGRIIVAGSLRAGPLVEFRVPDRDQLPVYRVRVLEVTSEDYGIRDPAQYRAVITNN